MMHIPTRSQLAVIGAVSAGMALAVSEVVSRVVGAPVSMVLGVGGRFIDEFAGSLKEFAVSVFGTNDKPALVIGTVVISLLVGAFVVMGLPKSRWIPVAGFVAFGVLGVWAQSTDPQVSLASACVVGVVSVICGLFCVVVLVRAAQPGTIETPEAQSGAAAAISRRKFLTASAVAATAASVLAWSARAVARGDVLEAAQNLVLPTPLNRVELPTQPFALDGVSEYVTPVKSFYRIDTALVIPEVDIADWSLDIGGMVDRPISITYEELLAFPSVEVAVTLQCVSNEIGDNLVGNAIWQGVPLRDLLDRVGVQAGAEQVFSTSVDGWTCGFPIAALDGDRKAIVAYAMNGEKLIPRHGFPARLVVAGLYGYVSATKWLRTINLTTWDEQDGYWVPRGWSKEGPIKLASRIDVPRRGDRMEPGSMYFGGVAWLPNTGVSGVEISVDGGDWQAAELGRVVDADTWVQWRAPWTATPGEHSVRVRAIDANGTPQIEGLADPAPNGATGLHEVRFFVKG